eukprot:s2050_g11.t2
MKPDGVAAAKLCRGTWAEALRLLRDNPHSCSEDPVSYVSCDVVNVVTADADPETLPPVPTMPAALQQVNIGAVMARLDDKHGHVMLVLGPLRPYDGHTPSEVERRIWLVDVMHVSKQAPGYTETTYLLTEAESGYVLDGCEDGEGSPVWHDEESPLPSVEFWIPPIAAAPHVALQVVSALRANQQSWSCSSAIYSVTVARCCCCECDVAEAPARLPPPICSTLVTGFWRLYSLEMDMPSILTCPLRCHPAQLRACAVRAGFRIFPQLSSCCSHPIRAFA